MEFEGVEKRADIRVVHGNLLNEIEPNFWFDLVTCAGGEILSSIENSACRAFILSESSLILFSDHFTILTCGETNLAKAITYFVEHQAHLEISYLRFSRKNERYPERQPTTFNQDAHQLSQFLAGSVTRLGPPHGQHISCFTYQKELLEHEQSVFELLAYDLSKAISDDYMSNGLTALQLVDMLGLTQTLKGFIFDVYEFTPVGYSLNGIKDQHYITVHITPQASCSFLSVMSNYPLGHSIKNITSAIDPNRFDVLEIMPLRFGVARCPELLGFQLSNASHHLSKQMTQRFISYQRNPN